LAKVGGGKKKKKSCREHDGRMAVGDKNGTFGGEEATPEGLGEKNRMFLERKSEKEEDSSIRNGDVGGGRGRLRFPLGVRC